MKKLILSLFFLISTFASAQKTEFRASLNSGLFSFGGNSAENSSGILGGNNNYTNNPYGTQSGLGLGFSLNYKYISSNNFILGTDIGYENLKSKIDINIIYQDFFDGPNLNATGKTNIIINTINIEPFLGYRISTEKVNFDISAGTDIGFILSAKEKGSAVASDGKTYETSLDRKTISTDFRPRVQVDAHYKKFGVFLGYSFGATNYMKDYIGGNPDAKSKILRFGLTYQLK